MKGPTVLVGVLVAGIVFTFAMSVRHAVLERRAIESQPPVSIPTPAVLPQ
jgi:hypothetical protein